jgi:epoxyqueuosine reductase
MREMLRSRNVKNLANECGFELAGIALAAPVPEAEYYLHWVAAGMAGRMGYLTDHRAELRRDPRSLLRTARSIICVAKLYNTAGPRTATSAKDSGWISRYAWGEKDYHEVLRRGLEKLADRLVEAAGPFEYRICVDTAPLLERSYARMAGLGWIGRNSCLINQQWGSYLFLGEILTSLDLEPDVPAPDRCGTCTRCVDACPTEAIVPGIGNAGPQYSLDARRCISYLTIELKGPAPEETRGGAGNHVFGCDICQDVCPWNSDAPESSDPAFASVNVEPPLEELAALGMDGFGAKFRNTAVVRARYSGFLRNVATAMGNSGEERFREPLQKMMQYGDSEIAHHAAWALRKLEEPDEQTARPGRII